jgi:uncharacterized protein YdeI (YjbR/CyaY-like superfamily)
MTSDPTGPDGLPVALFPAQADWESWLEKYHQESRGLWMRLAKKASSLRSLSYDEAVESALCFGWIDGQKRSYDNDSWLQRFTPRGRRSVWSKVNRGKVEALEKAGRMRPAGLASVELARADGRLEAAYDSARTATVPPDLERELERRPAAKAFFETLTGANRYAILVRLQTAIRPETRAKRLAEFVGMLEREEKIYP